MPLRAVMRPDQRSRRTFVVLVCAALLVCAAAFAMTVRGSNASFPWLIATVRAFVIATPIAVGLYVRDRRPTSRFGMLLVATGFLWSLTALSESGNEVLYSAGRVSAWLVEPTVVFVLLAFPFGRLEERAARRLVAAFALVAATLYFPTALVVGSYPEPTPWSSCGTDCPGNAFQVTSHQPGVIEAVVQPSREVLTALLFVGAMLVLVRRIAHDSRLARRVQMPVLAVAAARMSVFPAYLAARAADSASVDALGWIYLLTLPAIAFAFLAGILRWRLFLGSALQRLTIGLEAPSANGRLRRVLAEAVEDPTLDVVYRATRASGGWVDSAGRPVSLPRDDPHHAVTEIERDGAPVAALIHDPALRDYPGLLEATGSIAAMALDNERLAADLQASLRELRASRARIQASADAERRRIERDLHDGAQQRLVTLQMRLELARDLLETDPQASGRLLREVGGDAEHALEDVRSLARGVYPPLLAERGLADALRSAGRHSSQVVTVRSEHMDRYSQEIESAVYFCCLEALQNAAKHAGPDAAVAVRLSGNGALRFAVRDDGEGFDEAERPPGAGLTSMRDRISVVGGTMTIRSSPGEGTVVSGSVPASPLPREHEPRSVRRATWRSAFPTH